MNVVFAVFISALFLSAESVLAKTQIEIQRDHCKSIKARVFTPGISAGIQFKPNAKELQAKLAKLDTDRFCDCVFMQFVNMFGEQKTIEMMNFPEPSGTSEQLLAEHGQKQEIYFSCFSVQAGDVKPPSPQEVLKALVPSYPEKRSIAKSPAVDNDPNKVQKTKSRLSALQSSLEAYKTQFNALPANLPGLLGKKEVPVSLNDLKDGWGRSIIYEVKGNNFLVSSPGPDGKRGTGDDIYN